MPFLAHLAELRKRILIIAAAVTVGGSVSYVFALRLLTLLAKPAGDLQLHYFSPLEPFMVKFKVALFAGVVIALPVIMYQLIVFVAPALKEKEKKLIYPAIFFLVLLFAVGVVFGYMFVMKPSTAWLIGQAGDTLKATVSAEKYVTFATWFLIAFGVAFETPLFILLLVRFGVITPKKLRGAWRYAVLIILTVASVITPDWNPVTMLAVASPMFLFYLVSVALAGFVAPRPAS